MKMSAKYQNPDLLEEPSLVLPTTFHTDLQTIYKNFCQTT